MLLYWKIRYVDRRDKTMHDRTLVLATEDLDAPERAAVEAAFELSTAANYRRMVKYRHLFTEVSDSEATSMFKGCDHFNGFCVPDYFEDQEGAVVASIAEAMTGDPNWVAAPSGLKKHDLEYFFSEKSPIDVQTLSLNDEERLVLELFVRDCEELERSAMSREGPGKLSTIGARRELKTAVTDEEIRSFVMIFRRLYMTNEPAGLKKAAVVFCKLLAGHPLSMWVQGTASEYDEALQTPPSFFPNLTSGGLSFRTKDLIDAFLYTQYAHQPNKKSTANFTTCLTAVGSDSTVLTWLFLTEMWSISLLMRSMGGVVKQILDFYCAHHQLQPSVLGSISHGHPAIGALETKAAQRERVLLEKAKAMATAQWTERGEPAGEYDQILAAAKARLAQELSC